MSLFDASFYRARPWLRQFAGRNWRKRLLGQLPSPGVHAGTEVTGYSDYTMGHDPRYIDWNRCARLDELVSKQFQGSELQRLHLWIDVSRSMQAGQPAKFDQARRLAGHLASIALDSGESVRVFGVASGVERASPPFRQLPRLPELCRYLTDLELTDAPLNLAVSAASYLSSRPRPAAVVFLGDLIDLQATQFGAAVRQLRSKGCPVYFLQFYDRSESHPDLSGPVKLTDVEQSGWSFGVDLTAEDRQLYRQVFQEYCEEVRYFCRQFGVGLLQIETNASPEDCLITMMRVIGRAA